MKKFFLGAVVSLFLALPAFSQEYKPYVDEKDGYSLSYPSDWVVEKNSGDFDASFTSKDGAILWGIKSNELDTKVSSLDFLKEMDKILVTKKFVKDGDFQKVDAKDLEKIGVDEGSYIFYSAEGIKAFITVFMKGNKSIVVTQIIANEFYKDESKIGILGKISDSFAFKK